MLHEDGYVELRDRSKDIIISGRREHLDHRGVEGVIIKHPAVANVAVVVAKPDEKWGEDALRWPSSC